MSLIYCLLVSKCTNCGKKKQTHHLCFCDPFFKHFDYGCTIQRQLFLWNYKKYFATTHNSWVKMLYQPCLIPDIPRHLCLGVSCQSQIYQKEKCSQISENPILPYFESTHFGFQILIKLRLLIYRFYLFVCSSPFHHFRNSHQLIILWIYNIVDVSILLKTKRESGESWNQCRRKESIGKQEWNILNI